MFVHQFVLDRFRTGRRDTGRPHGLVFRKRLLGEERARQVQIAAWPGRIVAERPEILDGSLDLVVGQRVAKCGHATVERAHLPAAMSHGHPVGEWLDGVDRAVGEIGASCPLSRGS